MADFRDNRFFPQSLILFLMVFGILLTQPANAGGSSRFQPLPGLMDIRSSYSDGAHSLEEIVKMASSRGFKVLCLADHHRIAVSYGFPPFRRIMSYQKEFPSLVTHGIQKYLMEIDHLSARYPDMILIPGCILSPYYYWSGSWFAKNLTLHGYDRRMLIFNLDKPEDYQDIPELGNSFSLRYTGHFLPGLLFFFIPFVIGVFLFMRWRGYTRWAGLCLCILSLTAMVDYNPFKGSLFSPYVVNQGIEPYQEVIDYVNEKGGLIFWNYPEQRSGVRDYGPIALNTPAYPEVLYKARDYTGFAAIYGDRMTITDPGKEWDRVLGAFCKGDRDRPPWGISTADFHEDGRLGLNLGSFPTTFFVKEVSRRGVIEAMNQGRMYCSRSDGSVWPVLDFFSLRGQTGPEVEMGETLFTSSVPTIRFKVSYAARQTKKIEILLIRGGTLIKTFEGVTPLEVEYVDREAPVGMMTYYRLMDRQKHLTSNPVFITFRPGSG